MKQTLCAMLLLGASATAWGQLSAYDLSLLEPRPGDSPETRLIKERTLQREIARTEAELARSNRRLDKLEQERREAEAAIMEAIRQAENDHLPKSQRRQSRPDTAGARVITVK